MNLLVISILCVPTILPLPAPAQAPVTAWARVAREAQAQFEERRLAEAAESGKQALQLAKHLGPLDPTVASTYNLLGLIYHEWGHCTDSRTNYAHAIKIWRRLPDPNPRHIFSAVTNLLSVLCECEDFGAAEKAYRSSEPDLQRYRSDLMDDVKLLSIRAMIDTGRKDYPRAEALFRQAIQLMEKAPLATPLDVAAQRSNLSVMLYQRGRHAGALAESERAIAMFEQSVPRHPVLVAALNNAACSLAGLGRKGESERMFQRALQAAGDLYGEDNRGSAKIMLNYARVLRENKQSAAADAWQKKGGEAFRRTRARDSATVDVEELKAMRTVDRH